MYIHKHEANHSYEPAVMRAMAPRTLGYLARDSDRSVRKSNAETRKATKQNMACGKALAAEYVNHVWANVRQRAKALGRSLLRKSTGEKALAEVECPYNRCVVIQCCAKSKRVAVGKPEWLACATNRASR